MNFSGKIRVGVIRGGPSPEYEVSLKTGSDVLKSLPEKYHPVDIFIDKKGVWHISGIPKTPDKIANHVDVFFNALHGSYGEDGTVQRLLDDLKKPYTGSDAVSSAIGMNKHLSKKKFREHDLRTPHYEVIKQEERGQSKLFGVFATLRKPLVVKPMSAGSSVGVSIVKEWEEFVRAVDIAFQFSNDVIVEEMIEGREATCGVVESAKEKGEAYALLPIEIIKPKENTFFDYDAKYSGKSQEICPGDFSPEETSAIQDFAVRAHKALGLRHYSRSDFIVAPDSIYILEVNSLPGLTSESLIPKALSAADCGFADFLDHVIVLALRD